MQSMPYDSGRQSSVCAKLEPAGCENSKIQDVLYIDYSVLFFSGSSDMIISYMTLLTLLSIICLIIYSFIIKWPEN